MIKEFKLFEIGLDLNKDKIYEGINIGEPKVGDYVICYYDNEDVFGYSILEQDFIHNKIGKIININNGLICPYAITYNNIPEYLVNGYKFDIDYILLGSSVIKYFSEDLEELKIILSSNKFNL